MKHSEEKELQQATSPVGVPVGLHQMLPKQPCIKERWREQITQKKKKDIYLNFIFGVNQTLSINAVFCSIGEVYEIGFGQSKFPRKVSA